MSLFHDEAGHVSVIESHQFQPIMGDISSIMRNLLMDLSFTILVSWAHRGFAVLERHMNSMSFYCHGAM